MTVVQVPITPLSGAKPLRQDHLKYTLGRSSERKKSKEPNERFMKVDYQSNQCNTQVAPDSAFRVWGLVLAATIARRAAI
jgi:hypothetical protein